MRGCKGEEDQQQEGERRCLKNKGCLIKQITFLGKEEAFVNSPLLDRGSPFLCTFRQLRGDKR